MAEPVEMSFWIWTQVGPRNHALDGGLDLPMERGNFERQGAAHCRVQIPAMRCAKMAEPIKMQFGMLSQVGSGNHVLDGAHIALPDMIEPSVCSGDCVIVMNFSHLFKQCHGHDTHLMCVAMITGENRKPDTDCHIILATRTSVLFT